MYRAHHTPQGEQILSRATKIDGQRVVLAISHDPYYDAPDCWVVVLVVGASRRAKKIVREQAIVPHAQRQGRVGLQALRWAIGELDQIQKQFPARTLVVYGSDPTRQHAYRVLTRYGFVHGRYADQEEVFFRDPPRFQAYRERVARRAKPVRNPAEFVAPRVDRRVLDNRVRPLYAPAVQRRVVANSQVTLPDAVVRFFLPDAEGAYDPSALVPEAGILKVIVDARNLGPDRLTRLGLWHRFFQSYHEYRALRPARFGSMRPALAGLSPKAANQAAQILGEPYAVTVSPRTAWWRASPRDYLGLEAHFDAMGMALAFPKGIVYAVRPRNGVAHPPEVREALRALLRPYEVSDTARVRAWVSKATQRGVVTMTSHDLADDSGCDRTLYDRLLG